MIFLKTEEYMNPLFNMKFINKKNIRKDVKKVFTNTKHLFYLTSSGQLHTIFYTEDKNSHQFTEGLLETSLTHPIRDCAFSYSQAVLVFYPPEEEKNEEDDKHKPAPLSKVTSSELESDLKDPLKTTEFQKIEMNEEESKLD